MEVGSQLYAIAEYVPKDASDLWHVGKPYTVFDYETEGIGAFYVATELGRSFFVRRLKCPYLADRNWRIVKESDLTPEQRRMAGLPSAWPERNDMADAMHYLFGGVDFAKREDATTIAELREHIDALEKGAEQTLKSIDQRIEELEEWAKVEVRNKNVWPKIGDTVFFIDNEGDVQRTKWAGNCADINLHSFLGVYKTAEEAKEIAQSVQQYVAWRSERVD